MDLENNIKEFLSSIDVDFDLPYQTNYFQILEDLLMIFEINPEINEELSEPQLCLKYYLEITLEKLLKLLYKYDSNTEKVNELKKLDLPEQRTQEWYDMRKNKLTASSFADAIGKGHFKSRDQSLLDKIVDTPFVMNPITEWGVKYEEVATRFYEYLTESSIYEFGLIPHPKFPAFGASPDGICDTNSPPEYIGRMLEIKCPPKRKFTKTVPKHYWMQMQGQLEVCDLDECDFLQVKLEEYSNVKEYEEDVFIKDSIQHGYTKQGYPKGVILSYKESRLRIKFAASFTLLHFKTKLLLPLSAVNVSVICSLSWLHDPSDSYFTVIFFLVPTPSIRTPCPSKHRTAQSLGNNFSPNGLNTI